MLYATYTNIYFIHMMILFFAPSLNRLAKVDIALFTK